MAHNRKSLAIGTAALAAGLIVFLLVLKVSKNSAPASRESSDSEILAQLETKTPAPVATASRVRDNLAQPTPPLQSAKSEPAPTPLTAQQLVAEILEISSTEGPITAEKAERFKRNLEELIKLGAASVPAIRELLGKKVEYDFADVTGGDQMGYPSLRASMIDALKQIG